MPSHIASSTLRTERGLTAARRPPLQPPNSETWPSLGLVQEPSLPCWLRQGPGRLRSAHPLPLLNFCAAFFATIGLWRPGGTAESQSTEYIRRERRQEGWFFLFTSLLHALIQPRPYLQKQVRNEDVLAGDDHCSPQTPKRPFRGPRALSSSSHPYSVLGSTRHS